MQSPIILYPGDKWTIGEERDNVKSIELYEQDFAAEHKFYENSLVIHFRRIKKIGEYI